MVFLTHHLSLVTHPLSLVLTPPQNPLKYHLILIQFSTFRHSALICSKLEKELHVWRPDRFLEARLTEIGLIFWRFSEKV